MAAQDPKDRPKPKSKNKRKPADAPPAPGGPANGRAKPHARGFRGFVNTPGTTPEEEGLTPPELRFCREMAIDNNSEDAFARSGISAGTNNGKRHMIAEMMARPRVAAEIARQREMMAQRFGCDRDTLIGEAMLVARFDPRSIIVDDFGRIQVADGFPIEATRAISSVKRKVTTMGENSSTEVDVKFCDKLKALELLMRVMGMLREDRVDVRVTQETDSAADLRFYTEEEIDYEIAQAQRVLERKVAERKAQAVPAIAPSGEG